MTHELTTEDHRAIDRTPALAGHIFDRGELDRLEEIFTPEAVYEVTYVISGGGRSVYFAGDTLLIPELHTLTDRYGPLDVALLPVNGLHTRIPRSRQVVMNAEEAAELTATLRPKLAIPQHYAFTGGTIGDTLFLKSDKDPALFVDAVHRLVPDVPVKVINPGEPLTITP
jgi:L-ascorbate metabolism protein UlaG (beta-lactamase superfamily)